MSSANQRISTVKKKSYTKNVINSVETLETMAARTLIRLTQVWLSVALAGAVQPSATIPPRGWNSYDSYTWRVTETEFLANCAAVAAALKPSGYE